MKLKVAELVSRRLTALGVVRCFSVAGGGSMHLNDSFGRNAELSCTYMHHEQACAIAAEGYARIAGRPAVVSVTSGPGAINALNGVFGAYTDSVPMIIISGQVKRETSIFFQKARGLRQLGDQEARSQEFIPAFVKYYVCVTDASKCLEIIDNAISLCTSGRPGPSWIEIPIDIQGEWVELKDHDLYRPLKKTCIHISANPKGEIFQACTDLIRACKRPLILMGTGVRIANAESSVLMFARRLQIPIVTAWTHDTIDNNDPLFIGRPGTIGTRPGNFAVQSCDLLIVLGSRLNIRQVSYSWDSFAKNANVIMVDIDSAELDKPYLDLRLGICLDIKQFIEGLTSYMLEHFNNQDWVTKASVFKPWIQRLLEIKNRFEPKYEDYIHDSREDSINPYHFMFELNKYLRPNHQIVCGDATACIVPFQILSLNGKQRMFSNSGCASMGYDLPAGIGAAIAARERDTICPTIILAGDGSIMMNLQELQTLSASKLDIVLFLLDNNGYLSIKQTQSNFFGNEYGASPDSGLTFPDFRRLCTAFDLPVYEIISMYNIGEILQKALCGPSDTPRLCIVRLSAKQEFEPRLKSRLVEGKFKTPDLDDMFPHIDDGELQDIRQYLIG